MKWTANPITIRITTNVIHTISQIFSESSKSVTMPNSNIAPTHHKVILIASKTKWLTNSFIMMFGIIQERMQ